MRWTQTLIPTLKETPADAEILSHKLLLRAGLLRKVSGGVYTFLPLGTRVLHKVAQIVREEMDRAGAIEVSMPCIQPADIWHASGRYAAMGDGLYKVKDRTQKDWVLSPTAEEVITTLAANEINSYKQLPKNFYQIGTKFRDEIRPRFGLMRAREFVMKDAYSFDTTDEGAMESYRKMYDAYTRIFRRCGLRAFPCEADTGVIGGNYSHEFMVPAETGENEVVYCESGRYAANIEKATSRGPLIPTPATDTGTAPEKFPTPGVVTIEALAASPYRVAAEAQIKTLVLMVKRAEGDEADPVLALVRGDDQLNEAKFAGAVGTNVFRPATAEEVFAALGAHPGSLGAIRSTLKTPGLRVIADLALRGAAGMTTGANEDGCHCRHVNVERDLQVTHWADLRTVQPGELCAVTGQPLKIQRAIEVGHVFKLGTKYSTALNALYLDEAGHQHPCVMGCYGIGVTRTVQAIIEQGHDKDGIVWPLTTAPFAVGLTPLNVAPGSQAMQLATQLEAELTARGVEVLLDDRDDRPGVKFKDADLIGIPLRVNLGEKSLARGELELKPRAGALATVKIGQATQAILDWLATETQRLSGLLPAS